MQWKFTTFILVNILVLAGCSGSGAGSTSTVEPTVTRFPPTVTYTPPTLTTATANPTYTPTSVASFVHYMIVLDASSGMNGDFDGGTKWDAASESIQAILDGLEPDANYGLVVLGGSNVTNEDSCDQPSVARTLFSTERVVSDQIMSLQPGGGGSLVSAFTLAYRHFEGLPTNTVHVLIVITDAGDECRRQDEWAGLENLYKVTDEAGVDFHSEIIVMDQMIDLSVDGAASRMEALSPDINIRLLQNGASLQDALDSAIGEIQDYVKSALAARPTQTVEPASQTPTPDSSISSDTPGASSYTLTPRPGTPTVTPSVTLTPLPASATPSLTPSRMLSPTPTLPPSVELLSYKFLAKGIGCQVDIVLKVSGSPALGSFHVRNASHGPAGEVYSQITLPVGTYNNTSVTLDGNRPEYYSHEVWFEYGGVQTNRLTNLVCPLVPTATPSS